jgi:PAS domain S-box-containing protein
MDEKIIKLLLIEDNPGDARLIKEMLAESKIARFELKHASLIRAGLDDLSEKNFDVVLLDLSLPDSHGIETFNKVRAHAPLMPIIVLTSLDDELLAIEAAQRGAQDYLVKGHVDGNLLIRSILYAMERKHAEEALRKAHDEMELRVMERTAQLSLSYDLLLKEIEERKHAEKALQKSEFRYRTIVEMTNEGIWSLDRDFQIVFINKKGAEMLGYHSEEMLGRRITDFVLEDDLADHQGMIQALSHGTSESFEGRYRHRNGGSKWMLVSATPLLNGNNRFAGSIIMVTDITERKVYEAEILELNSELELRVQERTEELSKANKALKESEETARSTINAATESLMLIDCEGTILTLNKSAAERLCGTIEDLVGTNSYSIIPQDLAINRRKYAEEVILMCRPLHFEDMLQGMWLENSIYPVFNEHGSVTRLAIYSIDITERKRINDELRKAKESAESAARLKAEFTANMSHEIRTPMNGIIGMVSLLMDDSATPEQMDCLETVKTSSYALLDIVNDILDFSKIEQGMMDVECRPFHLRDLIDATISTFALGARNKGLSLSKDISDDLPRVLMGDQVRIRQIILNLLGNAIKFTENGEVKISVSSFLKYDGYWEVLLSVEDTGIGISPAAMGELFSPFTQAESSTTRRFGGTGLGLTISRSLVELMGGKIWAESSPGEGSTFYVLLNLKEASLAPPEIICVHNTTVKRKMLKVLLAEDNMINQQVILKMLRRLGHEADSAVDGKAAVEAAICGKYDLILMDVQMPVMDGLEATRHIRRLFAGRPKIIALTASALKEDREMCLQAGMNDFLSKPIRLQDLKVALDAI